MAGHRKPRSVKSQDALIHELQTAVRPFFVEEVARIFDCSPATVRRKWEHFGGFRLPGTSDIRFRPDRLRDVLEGKVA